MTRPTTIQMSIAALCAAAGAALAQPSNDDCAGAVELTLGGSAIASNAGATGTASSTCGFDDPNDIWFVYNSLDDRFVTFATCTAGFDSTLVAFDGACDGNQISCDDDGCDTGFGSAVTFSVQAGQAVYLRVAGEGRSSGVFTITAEPGRLVGNGPDVTLGDIHNTSHYGPVAGVHAYSIGSKTCNIGDEDLGWGSSWDGSPQLAMNMYSLHEGRLTQIGQGWAKTGCCAAAVTDEAACGPVTCNGVGGSLLGAGCRDTYGSGYNAIQGSLGPRSTINPYTGAMADANSGSFNDVDRRLQVEQSLMLPGAICFVEGVYVGVDDAPSGNWYNNASYRRVNVTGNYDLVVQDTTQATVPAIYAWRDHGLGANQPDPTVNIANVDVPSEGRFIAATKVTDLADGTYRYDYAVYNLNSHRSGGSFSVPIPAGLTPTNIGFNDVDYHSGEPYDNTDWTLSTDGGFITWECPEAFEQNQNTNALRWGTMYNFWFEIDAPPANGQLELGLFRPGLQTSVFWNGSIPASSCACELGGDPTAVAVDDLLLYLDLWFDFDPAADLNGDDAVSVSDLLEFLDCWFDATNGGTCQ